MSTSNPCVLPDVHTKVPAVLKENTLGQKCSRLRIIYYPQNNMGGENNGYAD